MTQRVLRYLSGMAGVLLLIIGVGLLVAPGRQADMFAVLPSGPAGLSTIRADLAGLFLGTGAFALGGAIAASVSALSVTTVFLVVIACARLINLIADGSSPGALRSLGVEVVISAVLILTIASIRKQKAVRLRAIVAVPVAIAVLLGVAFTFQRELGLMLLRRTIEQNVADQLVPSLPDGLHVGVCGSGSPMPDPTRSGPCVVVIAGRHVFIVDVGEGGPRTLALMGVQPALVDGVLLTHFHSDHIGGLGELMLQRWATGGHTDPTPVYGPQGVQSVVDGFNSAYGLDKGYRIAHHGEETVPPSGAGGTAHAFDVTEGSDAGQIVLQQDGLTITAFPVNHAPIFPAVGYRFDYGGRSVVISGDTAVSPSLVKAATGADLLLHEGLQTRMVSVMHDALGGDARTGPAKITADIPSYHTTPEDAARAAAQAGVKQLVFYHTIPPLPIAYLNAAFLGDAPKLFTGPIIVSTDGLLLTLESGGSAITRRSLL